MGLFSIIPEGTQSAVGCFLPQHLKCWKAITADMWLLKHPINRIQVAVSPSTTSKYRGSPHIDTESKASDHIGSRNQVITTKTGHRSGTWPRPVKRFFFQVLPDSKKGWRNPTNFRLEGPQCLSKASTFSHTTSSRCYTGSEQKQLVHYYRPEGCLLPHSNCDTSQEVPSFSCQRSDTN